MNGKLDSEVAVITGGQLLRSGGSGEQSGGLSIEAVPLGRMGTADEIAKAVMWINSQSRSGEMQIVGQDIPAIDSTFYLKSGVRARLVDRSGSMVIVEIEKRRSDWIEWSEVKARIGWNDLLRPAALSDESSFTILAR